MIKSVTVINHMGDELKINLFNPQLSGLYIKSIKGISPEKANINTTEVSTNDGSIYTSSRLPERNIVMTLGFWGYSNIEEIRHKTYKFFPIKKEVRLIFETDLRISTISGIVESNEVNIFSKTEYTDVSIICPDPHFYAYNIENTGSVYFNGLEGIFEFPFENKSLSVPTLEFGIIKIKTEQLVVYNGDSDVGITILIHSLGEASNITIFNTKTKESFFIDTEKLIKMTGLGVVAGDDIIINTTKGSKSIRLYRNGEYKNILNCVGKNASWFQLTPGDNVFAYSADNGASNLQFSISNKIVYEGV